MWVFGGVGDCPTGYLDDHGEFIDCLGQNNQLLRFDPWTNIWTNPKCFGTIPSPRYGHSTAVIRDNVWLFGGYGGDLCAPDDLFEFDTCICTWTQIRPAGIGPQGRSHSSFSVVSDTQLILHGGVTILPEKTFSDTWILDLASQT